VIDILLSFSRGLDAQLVRLAKIGFAGRMFIQKRHNRDGLWNIEFRVVT
jgi:hypothetical protein